MQSDDSANLPIANHGTQHRIHVMAELFTPAYGKLVGHVGGQDMPLVVVAWTPIQAGVVNIFKARLSTRARGLCAAESGTKGPGRIAQTLRPGIRDLALQSVTHAFLQNRLQSVVFLVRVGQISPCKSLFAAR